MMRFTNYNEILYSYIVTLFTQNKFDLANDILKLVQFSFTHQESITPLINSLKSIIDYIEWKKIISSDTESHQREYAEQLAERCIYQFLNITNQFDIVDVIIVKLTEIYVYYNKTEELGDLLKLYTEKNPKYLNAFKFLHKYQENFDSKNSLKTLEQIVSLCPFDSMAFEYAKVMYTRKHDTITCLDVIFDMLDYAMWKSDEEIWKFFEKILLNIQRNTEIKDCLNENWKIRQTYWPSYHFAKYTNTSLNNVKAIIATVLLGPHSEYVKCAKNCENLHKSKLVSALEMYHWLNSTNR